MVEWKDWEVEKPTEIGFYWFYGSVRGQTEQPKEFHVLRVKGKLVNKVPMLTLNGYFAFDFSPMVGHWAPAVMPPTDALDV